MGRIAPSLRAVPKLLCGVGLRQEPIYVEDPQGRIIRTLDDWQRPSKAPMRFQPRRPLR